MVCAIKHSQKIYEIVPAPKFIFEIIISQLFNQIRYCFLVMIAKICGIHIWKQQHFV